MVFLALGIYRATGENKIQAVLFIVMGLGFACMGIMNKGYLPKYSKIINILSWVFVIIAALLFLYAIQVGSL
jgi:drug/metabolite transporter (DMT)-like permease